MGSAKNCIRRVPRPWDRQDALHDVHLVAALGMFALLFYGAWKLELPQREKLRL